MKKTIDAGKVCECCGATLVRPTEVSFCDYCKEKIDEDSYMDSTVFFEGHGNTQRYEFCSWQCWMDWIRTLTLNKKMINFITPPYLGGSAKDFEEEYNSFIRSLSTKARNEK